MKPLRGMRYENRRAALGNARVAGIFTATAAASQGLGWADPAGALTGGIITFGMNFPTNKRLNS